MIESYREAKAKILRQQSMTEAEIAAIHVEVQRAVVHAPWPHRGRSALAEYARKANDERLESIARLRADADWDAAHSRAWERARLVAERAVRDISHLRYGIRVLRSSIRSLDYALSLLESAKSDHRPADPPLTLSTWKARVCASEDEDDPTSVLGVRLTPREHTVALCMSEWMTCPEMAESLGISVETVREYVARIRKKVRDFEHINRTAQENVADSVEHGRSPIRDGRSRFSEVSLHPPEGNSVSLDPR